MFCVFTGEKVQCRDGPNGLWYRAKIKGIVSNDKNGFFYLIHYVGWVEHYDEWVTEELVRADDIDLPYDKTGYHSVSYLYEHSVPLGKYILAQPDTHSALMLDRCPVCTKLVPNADNHCRYRHGISAH